MNIIINDISYELIKTDDKDGYIEYAVKKNDSLMGYLTKGGAEIHYTARDTEDNIRGTAETLRDALNNMILDMFYTLSYTGDRHIKTVGAWTEGAELTVEYVKNDYVKQTTRKVKYNKAAGDLFITLDNKKYFYYEFS